MQQREVEPGAWPDLALPGWQESARLLHLWSQIIGKVRLALAPMANHWWHVPLYVTARGLSTSLIPYGSSGLDVELDLVSGRLEVRTTDGGIESFPLEGTSVAGFHRRFFETLRRMGVRVSIHPLAVEIPEVVYLDRDEADRPYRPEWVRRFFHVLVRVDRVMKEFRGSFVGKASPVHFFWGSFDLAVTRFSGRRAPLHPGGAPHVSDEVMREAYSHEVSSAGFWPGGVGFPEAIFYSYAYPEPDGFAAARVQPAAAGYDRSLREFVLPYESVRSAPDPEGELKGFLESTYLAAAELGRWPRRELERQLFQPAKDLGRRDELHV